MRYLNNKLRLWIEKALGINPYKIKPHGLCPVQADGILKDGKYYYFRARGTDVRIIIAETEEEYFENEKVLFERSLKYGHMWDAGYLLREDAIRICTLWINEYFDNQQSL
jgi:hypothetical protein